MIRPHAPVAFRYVDYGKVFVPNGALDFSTLACSDDEVGRFGAQLFNRGLVFPENSAFAGDIGGVSAALLMFEGGYLFALVQRRREGELSANPRTDRPFNQVRFVVLNRDAIEQAFASRAALYTGLALAARDPEARIWLRDYVAGGEQQVWAPTLKRLEPLAPDPEAVRFVTNAVLTAARAADGKPQPISVPLPPGQGLIERLQLVEAVQYWVLPRLGVLSFALDYVSIQNVHLRLFELPPDAPAPLPPERVFTPGPSAGRFPEDHFAALSLLGHEALYDPALPGLVGLDVSAAEAIGLYKVEKEAEPLPGAEALRLYPEVARLGERRFNLLRRVPREDVLGLLRRDDLPPNLRLDLLQTAFDAGLGLLVSYAPAHLAVPRAARDDERIRGLLRASVAKSPETSLGLGTPEDQAELYRDLLRARRPAPPTGQGQATAAAHEPLVLATGQPLLEALLLGRRGPPLAAALQAATADDPALFNEAVAVLDRATDLRGLLWLWQSTGRRDFKQFTGLLERAVQPRWYAELARAADAWRQLLAEGRELAAAAGPPEAAPASGAPAGAGAEPIETSAGAGALLRALPRNLIPFVWEASLATAEHDAPFAEWWLFNEALALPNQLPALWDAMQRLPAGSLAEAGPALNFMLGRQPGLSLLQACTPPGDDGPNEALYATVLRAWLLAGFRSPVGDLTLATEDVELLVAHLPGSNDILAAVAGSPAQAPAVRGLPAEAALRWAASATGDRRIPYRLAGPDALLRHLADLPAADDALLWHLLVNDDATAPGRMPWSDYAALMARLRARLDAQNLPAASRVRAYLDLAAEVQPAVAGLFAEREIDLRRVLARLAAPPPEPIQPVDLRDGLLPLAVFHLQAPSPNLRERAAAWLRAGLQHADITSQLEPLPDKVLEYLRQNFGAGQPGLAATGHWIDAELARRADRLRVDPPTKTAPPRRVPSVPPSAAALARSFAGAPTLPAAPRAPGAARAEAAEVPRPVAAPLPGSSLPAADVPTGAVDDAAGGAAPAAQPIPEPLLGQLALPGAAPSASRDTAVWLWIAIVVLAILALGIVIGALVWIQSLQRDAALLAPLAAFLSQSA